jgi:hypothetical protein
MTLKTLLENLDEETLIKIKYECSELDKTQVWFEGNAGDVPHTFLGFNADYSDSIAISEDGKLEVTIGSPQRRNTYMSNGEWLDSLDEEEKLLMIIALLYNYDSGTVYYEQENFDNDNEWPDVLEKAVGFFEKRYGVIANRKGYLNWIRKNSAFRKKIKD